MFRKTILALTAVLAVGLAAPSEALAWRGGWGGWGGWHGGWGGWRGPGWGWGLGAVGLGIGLGVAAAAAPYYWGGYGYPNGYYGYPYGYANYYGYGGCYFVTQRLMTPYGWRWRRVQVCG